MGRNRRIEIDENTQIRSEYPKVERMDICGYTDWMKKNAEKRRRKR